MDTKMKAIESQLSENLKSVDLSKSIGKEVTLKGQVFKVKSLSGFAFVQIFTHNGIVQTIFEKSVEGTGIKEGVSIQIKGIVKEAKIKDAFISEKTAEVSFSQFNILSTPKEAIPFDITKKALNIKNDILFDYRILSMRHPKERAIFKIQQGIVHGLREYFIENDFTEIRSPKIVKEGAEGGANIFELKYFDQKAYLTQSPQFYKEFCVGVFQRVFEMAPVFRAEKHNTNRHINEYTSIDLELGPIDSFYDIMNIETGALHNMFEHLKKNYAFELELLKVEIPTFETIPSLKFSEAKDIIVNKIKLKDIEEGDFSPIEEQKLCQYVKKEMNSDFVFITHYPTAKRPFYAMDDPDSPEETLSFDLLFRGVEITTGGQRIHDFDALETKMKARGMNPEDFEFFTMAHKYGLPPHGGLGLGLERLTQKIIGLDSVKLATMFPRDINRLAP
jgi:nondiscriminating aspartyl-tRNA synthetase